MKLDVSLWQRICVIASLKEPCFISHKALRLRLSLKHSTNNVCRIYVLYTGELISMPTEQQNRNSVTCTFLFSSRCIEQVLHSGPVFKAASCGHCHSILPFWPRLYTTRKLILLLKECCQCHGASSPFYEWCACVTCFACAACTIIGDSCPVSALLTYLRKPKECQCDCRSVLVGRFLSARRRSPHHCSR